MAQCIVPEFDVDDPETSGPFDLIGYAISELATQTRINKGLYGVRREAERHAAFRQEIVLRKCKSGVVASLCHRTPYVNGTANGQSMSLYFCASD
jgi:hypothetical protein